MLKRLWMIFGPIIVAVTLAFLLIFLYPTELNHNIVDEKNSAVEISVESFKERSKKVQAFSDPNMRFVPYLGSSEWIRFDNMHPAVLPEKYNRSYRPYFLGQAGAASLSQYFGLQQILPELENKQVVFVISPQWFTESEHDLVSFQRFFNGDQLTSFLENQSDDIATRYAATRLLKQNPDILLKGIVQKLSKGEELSESDYLLIRVFSRFNRGQASLFGQLPVRSQLRYREHVGRYLKTLPSQFSYEELEDIAWKEAEANTTNNDWGMENHYFTSEIKKDLKRWSGHEKSYNFLKSSEYNDLQLLLSQFAKSKINVLFVIQPVNQKWAKYTGLSEEMYQATVQKIRYQLESQGFTNIADFSKDGDKPYFVKDTIHLGWLGWIAFDKAVDPFLSNPTPAPTYQLNDRFFSKDWAMYDGDAKEFQ